MAGRAHGVQSFQGALALHSVKLERIPRITRLGEQGTCLFPPVRCRSGRVSMGRFLRRHWAAMTRVALTALYIYFQFVRWQCHGDDLM